MPGEVRLDVDGADARQPLEREHVGRGRGDLLLVGDDQLLAAAGRDGEDARGELVAGVLLEQGRILAAVEEVFVGGVRLLALDDLALLVALVGLHGEAADGGALGQDDGEVALDDAVLGVLEDQVELGEGERIVEDGAAGEADQGEAGAGRGGEAEGDGAGLLGGEVGEGDPQVGLVRGRRPRVERGVSVATGWRRRREHRGRGGLRFVDAADEERGTEEGEPRKPAHGRAPCPGQEVPGSRSRTSGAGGAYRVGCGSRRPSSMTRLKYRVWRSAISSPGAS